MSARQRARASVRKAFAVALLCIPAGAAAQLVYKQIDAAGHVTYGDRPDAALATEAVPALDVAAALARNTAMSSRGAAMIDAKEAVRRLKQAEREQCSARPQQAQVGAAGTTTVTDRHASCRDELRHAIVQAQRRVDQTSRLLRESR